MPNQLTAAGLQIKSVTDIVNDLVIAFQALYGSDINVNQNSPDGQLINIFAQAAIDQLERIVDVYNSYSPNTAYGTSLDQRLAINGLFRKPATFTIINVNVVTSGSVNLNGLDNVYPTQPVFTIQDTLGNQYKLLASVAISGSGTHSEVFQAVDGGPLNPLTATITTLVTVQAGVTSVSNPGGPTTIGVAEETDSEFRIRHAKMFLLASTGPADAIQAALLALDGVTDALVVQNDTSGTVSGIPARSVWCIVENGVNSDIALAIYNKKAPGCGMKGSQTYVITRPNSTSFTSKWDVPISTNLYIKFTVTSRIPGITFDNTVLANSLATALSYKLNQVSNIGDIIILMNTIEPRAILSVVGVGTDGTNYFDSVSPSDYQHKFAVSAARITIT